VPGDVIRLRLGDIVLTRTRGPFWSIRPANILAVFGTQAIATLIAVYGLFMAPIGWDGQDSFGNMHWFGSF